MCTGDCQAARYSGSRQADDAVGLESDIHYRLCNYWTDGGTEWFKLTPEAALDVCSWIFAIGQKSPVPRLRLSDEELCSLAMDLFVDRGSASTSSLQRTFSIGYGRASRIMDILEEQGKVAPRRQNISTELLTID